MCVERLVVENTCGEALADFLVFDLLEKFARVVDRRSVHAGVLFQEPVWIERFIALDRAQSLVAVEEEPGARGKEHKEREEKRGKGTQGKGAEHRGKEQKARRDVVPQGQERFAGPGHGNFRGGDNAGLKSSVPKALFCNVCLGLVGFDGKDRGKSLQFVHGVFAFEIGVGL